MDNLENKCLNWLRNQCHENDEFYQIILKEFGLNILLLFTQKVSIPKNKIYDLSKKENCGLCHQFKKINYTSLLNINHKNIISLFCSTCGIKIRLAYLYSLIIDFIKVNFIDDKEFTSEVIKIFNTLLDETLNLSSLLIYYQNHNIDFQKELIFINFQLNTQKYPILERIPCFY